MSGPTQPSEPGQSRAGGESIPERGAEEAAREAAAGESARPEVLDKGAVYDRSRERTERLIRENRNFVADYMDSFVYGLGAMGRALEEEGRRDSASQVQRAAGELERTSRRVREESLVRIGRDLESRARERPLVAFGGAALAGFALSRVLKTRPADDQGKEE